MSSVWVVNLECGYPGLEDARKILSAKLQEAKRSKVRVVKLVHGYGSSGKGGVLRFGLRKSLKLRIKEGIIKAFIPGEDFSIFNPPTLELIEAVPELRADPDLNLVNEGVTVIWIR